MLCFTVCFDMLCFVLLFGFVRLILLRLFCFLIFVMCVYLKFLLLGQLYKLCSHFKVPVLFSMLYKRMIYCITKREISQNQINQVHIIIEYRKYVTYNKAQYYSLR